VNPHINRRSLLATCFAGIIARWHAPAVAGLRQSSDADRWFRDLVAEITSRPITGGPHSGELQNSLYGVEANRAGRRNPGDTPPSVSNFYLEAQLFPGEDELPWEIGLVWRVSTEQDALWWTVTDGGDWNLISGSWRFVTEPINTLASGQFIAPIGTPVTLQALVVGSLLAVAVNGGSVLRVGLPGRRSPGQVGILANCSEDYRRASGVTPYEGLSIWALDEGMGQISPLSPALSPGRASR
jgi:hypothetical protein